MHIGSETDISIYCWSCSLFYLVIDVYSKIRLMFVVQIYKSGKYIYN